KLILPKVKPRDLIRDDRWIFFPGDEVEVIGGEAIGNVGRRGKVLDVIRKMNSVTVEGLKLAKKHIPPNPIRPLGGIISKPMPIHFSNIKLVDPHVGKITDAKLIHKFNKLTGQRETVRLLKASGATLPVPADDGPIEKYEKTSPLDTPADVVNAVTWRPDILSVPFPARFLNQMERNKRMNSSRGQF
ncbi:Plastid ribosomal protein L24, partial [Entophlyctis sp. JEL0112]